MRSGLIAGVIGVHLFLISLLIPTFAKAETVLFCQEELSVGLTKENGFWETTNFKLKRYTIKFNLDYSKLFGLDDRRQYDCAPAYTTSPSSLACLSGYSNGESFMFNRTARRFVFSRPSAYGYDSDGVESDIMSGGTCKEF